MLSEVLLQTARCANQIVYYETLGTCYSKLITLRASKQELRTAAARCCKRNEHLQVAAQVVTL
jgi:hypothetical protein